MKRLAIALLVAVCVGSFELAIVGSLVRNYFPYEIARMNVRLDVSDANSSRVVQEIDVDFGSGAPSQVMIFHQARRFVEPLGTLLFLYEDVRVSSADGGEVPFEAFGRGSLWTIALGDPQGWASGIRRYRVEFTIHGVAEGGVEGPWDTLSWEVLPARGNAPIRQFEVQIVADRDPVDATCFQGGRVCRGDLLTFNGRVAIAIRDLSRGEAVSLVVRWPTGTIKAPPHYYSSMAFEPDPFRAEPWMVVWGLWWLVPAAFLYRRVRRANGDVRYAGALPGEIPADAASCLVEPASRTAAAVRSEPPQYVLPSDLPFVQTRGGDRTAVAAMVLSLLTRGFLRLERGPAGDDEVSRTAAPLDGLEDFEVHFLREGFAVSRSLRVAVVPRSLVESTTALLRTRAENAQFFRVRTPLQRKWLRAAVLGCMVLVVGLTAALANAAYLLLAWAMPFVSLVMVACAAQAESPGRSAFGTALFEQSEGFQLYLTTLDAQEWPRAEERDLFLRYLPYAVVLGCAHQWVGAGRAAVTASVADTDDSDARESAVDEINRIARYAELLGVGERRCSSRVSNEWVKHEYEAS